MGFGITPELLKQGDEQFRSMFPQFAGENGIGVFHEAFNDYVKQNNIDLSKSSVYAQYTEEGLKFHSVPKTLEQQAEYIHSRINDTMNASIQPQIPNVGTINAQPSMTAVTAIQSPITQHDAVQSVTSQIQSMQFLQRTAQNLDALSQIANPVAPAAGITLQTAAGNLGLSQSPNGYLQIGGYETHIPMQQFRQEMQNPQMQQQFVETFSKLPLNNNNFEDFGAGYKKNDNGTVENLLHTMSTYTRQQTKDSVVGFSAIMDYSEAQADMLSEIKEAISEMNEITKIRNEK